MKLQTAVVLLVAMAAAPVLAAETYMIDSDHTVPTFEIGHMGIATQRGEFLNPARKRSAD